MYHTENTIDTNYTRVLPRDLYNESKLLKCIGRLVLLIEDGHAPYGLQYEHEGEPFEIGLVEDGHLTFTNIHFSIGETELFLKTVYNSKNNYPLFLEYDNVDYEVFDEHGHFTKEFFSFTSEAHNF